jgi:glycosyltransferase involved in cell wall biosynthesis
MKSRDPLVSVAIITYNQKAFLRECVESCLRQEYQNLEIVVADDGSTDGTQELLKDYQRCYPGKFVLRLSNSNQGITKNSNQAHFACSGKYIAWMGGDDVMMSNKLSKQVSFMENDPDCAISYHDMEVFDNESKKMLYLGSQKNRPREGGVEVCIKHGTFNGACTTMVRAICAPKKGYNESFPVASDWCYWIDTLAGGGKIRYLPEVLSRYRRHSNNVTIKQSQIGQNLIDHLNTCNYVIAKYPVYIDEAIYRYSINIRTLRNSVPYSSALLFSAKTSFDLKSIVLLVLYFLSGKKIKL